MKKTEQFDILDINGNKTGIIANRTDTLTPGQYFLGMHAYIYNSDKKFLVQQRAYGKSFLPGCWEVHLGHTVAGESSMDCLLREVQEEIGLLIEPANAELIGRVLLGEGYTHFADIYFVCQEYNLECLKFQPGEVIAVKEIEIKDMLKMVDGMTYRPEEYRALIRNKIINLA